ncbi:MAG: hypothetical protein R3222_03855 [Balneolaceae bacterium]|nr:hypothetical protein [Balneolaceae bacterium]
MKTSTYATSNIALQITILVLLILALILQGCDNVISDVGFRFNTNTRTPSTSSSYSVSGTVTMEESGEPVDSAIVSLVNRPLYEDWEWGGYDYTNLGQFYTDSLGKYSFSRTTTQCGSRNFFVSAQATIDSVLYSASRQFVSCSGSNRIDFELKKWSPF